MTLERTQDQPTPEFTYRPIEDIAAVARTAANTEFTGCVQSLIERQDLADYLGQNISLAAQLTGWATRLSARAYADRDDGALYQAQKALYLLYEDNLKPPGLGGGRNQFDPLLLTIRGILERRWERFELDRAPVDRREIPTDPDAFREYFKGICKSHRMVGHPLFEFIETRATHGDLVSFFMSDGAVIVRFCDLVVLSMVGVEDEIRPELAENFWDEMGRGRFQERHAHLFRSLLEYAGVNLPEGSLIVDEFVGHLDWRGLTGYNLYLFLCLNRRNQYRSLGGLGAAEMMDPPQYGKVLSGCRRVGLTDEERLAYYAGHEEMDVVHGDGWLENVLIPLVGKYPDQRGEIITGALMRMNVTLDYYDGLFRKLSGDGP